MKYFLLAASLALASCATQRTLTPARPPADATSGGRDEGPAYTPAMLTQRPDSVIVQRAPSFIDKVMGRTPEPFKVAVTPARIGKKSTVSIYYGPATVTTTTVGKKATAATAEGAVATVIEKKAGPAIVASDSSTQNAILGGGNIQATNGNNNTPQLTAPVQQAADWRATLAKPTGYVLAGLGTVLLVGGCIYLIAAYKRRNLLHNNG
jgi:hypothetical protein